MGIEINLLTKKQHKFRPYRPYAIFLCLFILVGSGLTFYQVTVFNQQKNRLETEYKLQRAQTEANMKKLGNAVTRAHIKTVTTAIDWAKQQQRPLSSLFKQLAAQLPNRGYLTQFQYAQADQMVKLTIQTDTKQEVAYYLAALDELNFVAQVNIVHIDSQATYYFSEYQLLLREVK